MYRNIFYDISEKVVKLFTWNEKGERIQTEYPFKPYIYVESNNIKDAVSVYNTNLQKKEFVNQYERKKYIKECGIKRIFYNINAEQQWLIDQFGTLNKSGDFSKFPLKVFYLDIETYSPGKFPNPSLAEDAINLITIYDSLSEQFHTWGTKEYKGKVNTIFHKHDNEADMLTDFIKYWSKDYPDIVTGWASETFDIPYIINRITNVLGENWAEKLSPVKQLYRRDNVIKRFGKVEDKWYIRGVSLIDYLEAYKVFSKEKRERYSLNYIGKIELNEGKKEHLASTLPDMADNHYDDFVEYNIQDVNLIVKFEEKLGFLKLIRMLAYMGLTPLEQALGTISVVTGAMSVLAKEKGMIIPTFETMDTKNYEGGFVKEPKRGLIESVVSFDANSLYPNTIIGLNISPETKIGKILSKSDSGIEIRLINNKIYKLSQEKFINFIKQEELTITKAKTLYTQKKKGICPELLEVIYAERVTNKKEMLKLKKHKANLVTRMSHPDEQKDSKKIEEYKSKIKELNEQINKYDILQYTGKILANRIYGTFANKHSPFYDIDAASSITLSGQACVKEAGIILNTYIKEKYNIDDDCIVYMDTDSCFFSVKNVLTKLNIPLAKNNKITKETYDIINDFELILNQRITEWARKTFNTNDPRFVFKREKICGAGVFIQKKRYILHLLDDEGVEMDKLKYVGVEVASTTVPETVKPLIKNVIEKCIRTRDYNLTNEEYFKSYEEYKKMPLELIALPKGISDYDKYERLSSDFDVAKRTPLHSKSAIYYNHLLKILKLENKYEPIKSGSNIKYFYAAPNKHNIKSIAFLNQYPTEFNIEADKDLMFSKTIKPAVERLYEAIGWRIKNPLLRTACDLLNLLG